jgi:hypothetical protein
MGWISYLWESSQCKLHERCVLSLNLELTVSTRLSYLDIGIDYQASSIK